SIRGGPVGAERRGERRGPDPRWGDAREQWERSIAMATRTRRRSPPRRGRHTPAPNGSSPRGASRSPQRWVDRLSGRLPPLVRDAVERARGQDILLFASGLAFYALVSAIPLAIVAAWAAGVILGESRLHQLASDLRRVAPGGLGVGSFVGR